MLEATAFGVDTTVTVGLVLAVSGMIYALVRLLVKAEHTQEAQTKAIEESKAWQRQQQQTNEQVNLRLDRLERPNDERSHRTGRFPIVEDRER